MTVSLHRATADDLPAMATVDGRAFGIDYSDQDLTDLRLILDPDRFVLARDSGTTGGGTTGGGATRGGATRGGGDHAAEGEIVGVAGSFPFAITPPGGAPIAAEGVTWVSVAATHRRRGILRAMLGDLHAGYAAAGTPLAVLTASEGGIYGRFGYGVATTGRNVEIDRSRAVLRADAPDPGGVRFASTAEVRERVPDIHRRWCAGQPGALSRPSPWWDFALLDRPHQRRGGTSRFHLLHADGYVGYRLDSGVCRVVDFFAVTDEARIALWRVLLAMDLVTTVATGAVADDDPLRWLLTDARAVRTTRVGDDVWARVLDTPAVLAARRYAVDVDAVLEVRDPDGYAAGRFRLRGGPDGAECLPTDDAADLALDVPALGAIAFGGTRVHTLARAGRVSAADPAVARRLDAACTAEREPYAGTHF
ncbi:enhanced intracellular survival protein Eis [Pseudonocardia petroleophila]|uniref:GNAT family N-acetyltransferase n=1 Tax=Pseudonocardia petroleophila TaxID=37331 RepID=A0A7G7MDE7_9PSEU|nr:GNAT family N-acetyltransferase [Pseudonocardia petroleophila]QNG50808.1 GNAT family N-acetyltransferase [Pseudonocardia petroleophila]